MKLSILFLTVLLLSMANAQVCSYYNTPVLEVPVLFELNEGEAFFYELNLSSDVAVNYSIIPIISDLEFRIKDNLLSVNPNISGMHTVFILANTIEGCYDIKRVAFKVYKRPEIRFYYPEELKLEIPENAIQKFTILSKETNYFWYLNGKQVRNGSDSYIYRSNYTSSGNKWLFAVVKDKRGLNRTINWRIAVSNINREPIIKFPLPNILITKEDKGSTLNFNDYAFDPDGDQLMFTWAVFDEAGSRKNYSDIVDVKISELGTLTLVAKGNFGKKERIIFSADDGLVSIDFAPVLIEIAKSQNKTVFFDNINSTECQVDIVCEEWEDCLFGGIKQRICFDKNHCNQELDNITETAECEYGATCFDSIKNQDEKGVDCGGSCKPCPTCSDKTQNQGEEGIDCGGPCSLCPTCSDLIKNQDETDIDCGGVCSPCLANMSCQTHRDCQSFACSDNICQEATCSDLKRNQGEEKTDCGGPCTPCASCNDNLLNQGEEKTDCGGPCRPCMSCFDGIKNQEEVFIDCGGQCPCKILETYQSHKYLIFSLGAFFLALIILRIYIKKNYTYYLLFSSRMFSFMPSRLEDVEKHAKEAILSLKKLQAQLVSREYYKLNEDYKKVIVSFLEKILNFEGFDEASFRRELKTKVKNPYKRKLIAEFYAFAKKSTGSSTLFKLEMSEKIDATIKKIEMLK